MSTGIDFVLGQVQQRCELVGGEAVETGHEGLLGFFGPSGWGRPAVWIGRIGGGGETVGECADGLDQERGGGLVEFGVELAAADDGAGEGGVDVSEEDVEEVVDVLAGYLSGRSTSAMCLARPKLWQVEIYPLTSKDARPVSDHVAPPILRLRQV